MCLIANEDVDGVIWRRETPPSVTGLLNAPATDERSESRATMSLPAVRDQARTFMDGLARGDCAVQEWISSDIALLSRHFADIMALNAVDLRMEIVSDDACRKFHQDTVSARLICTYSGPGTEFGVSMDGGDPDVVYSVPTGCPVLLKGKSWSGASQPLTVHRSPPVEGTGVSRLLVVIGEPR